MKQRPRTGRRGRPSKFGRPSQVVALTLPDDVIETLRGLHADPAWAIVQLAERTRPRGLRQARRPSSVAELAHLPGKRALIVVQPRSLRSVSGISLIPLSDGRAFVALDVGAGIAELEIAVLDRIDELPANSLERQQLMEFRDLIRGWRRTSGLRFRSHGIIVVEGSDGSAPQALSKLGESRRRSPRQRP